MTLCLGKTGEPEKSSPNDLLLGVELQPLHRGVSRHAKAGAELHTECVGLRIPPKSERMSVAPV